MTPLSYRWSGDSFEVLPRHQKQADKEFVVGEIYTLEEVKGRSRASHNHFFASVEQGWLSLPEAVAERFPTAEFLRKYCLIKSGFHDQRSIVAASKAEAQRIAAFVRPVDEFAIVIVSECTVTIYTAKSQSKKAMGADAFQKSKTAVLDLHIALEGVPSRYFPPVEDVDDAIPEFNGEKTKPRVSVKADITTKESVDASH